MGTKHENKNKIDYDEKFMEAYNQYLEKRIDLIVWFSYRKD